jgi:para-nitrobenzyl esterase
MVRLAEARAHASTARTFMYEFAWPSRAFDGQMGAFHLSEVPFVFDSLDEQRSRRITGDGAPRHLADSMHKAWVSFARVGVPKAPELPEWPIYELPSRRTMRFDDNSTVVDDPWADERVLWDSVPL